MARVCFTQNLARHVRCPDADAAGHTVREVLDAYFAAHPQARSYILDEHGGLRPHVVVFVGDTRASDRRYLRDPVAATAEVWVMQALSGG